ncbi:Flagellar FliJ protein [Methylorubrum aminovorans]
MSAADIAKRLKRAERLTAVQEQMRRTAEWQLAQTRRDADAVEADRAALLAAVGSSAHGHLFLEASNRRLRGLAARATELERIAASQTADVREQGLALKRAELNAERIETLLDRERERVEAMERLDGLAQRRDASLP